jgi:hypothetical protein
MAKQKPVYTTELRRHGGDYYEPRLGTRCCAFSLMYILQHFYDFPDSPSRIWIEWYAKPVPGSVTVTPDSYPYYEGARIGRIQSGNRSHESSHGTWRVLPNDVVERHRTLYARVYYQE